MIYHIVEGEIKQTEDEEGEELIAVIDRADMLKELNAEDTFDQTVNTILRNDSLRFESHDHMDILCIHLHEDVNKLEQMAVHIFLQPHCLWMVCEHAQYLDEQIQSFMRYGLHDLTLGKVVCMCMEKFLDGESMRLDMLQDEIMELEDLVIGEHQEEISSKIFIQLRKRLLRQERCYEGMQTVLDNVLINDNQLLEDSILKSFKIMSGRVDRMAGRVQTLHDYVSEIREAYQAEVDIKLNVTMRIFTVITAVFLPLTLIVGWYGMNLKMPEYEVAYAYPIVIVVSVLIVLGLLMYFKKNRWF